MSIAVRREFTVDGNDIYFGLVAVKSVGDGAIDAIIEAREQGGSFKSLQDFCERVDIKQVNKRAIESLIISGAFDALDGHRAQHLASLDSVMKVAQSAQADRDRGQMNLFGDAEAAPAITITLPDVPEFDPLERAYAGKRATRLLCFWTSAGRIQGHHRKLYNRKHPNFSGTPYGFRRFRGRADNRSQEHYHQKRRRYGGPWV